MPAPELAFSRHAESAIRPNGDLEAAASLRGALAGRHRRAFAALGLELGRRSRLFAALPRRADDETFLDPAFAQWLNWMRARPAGEGGLERRLLRAFKPAPRARVRAGAPPALR